jgi:cation diffusion facilitator family transporter
MDAEKKRLGYLEGVLSSIINTVLAGFKLWVGLSAGSVAMIADAWHTFSDTLTSIVVIVGVWISSKPKDEGHPFGHGRAELIASIVIGTLLAVVGVNFFSDSITQLRNHKSVRFTLAAIVVFVSSVLIKEALARFSIWAGRKTRSQSLIADGWHHRSDALASAMILIGAFFAKTFWWMDGALGIVVSLLILWAAFQVIREASNSLMGGKPEQEVLEKLKALVTEEAPAIKEIHHVHLHRYGDHVEITFHGRLEGGSSLYSAHDICTKLEASIRTRLDMEATIHLEPIKQETR